MADARPTFLLPQRYTQRKTEEFSRPMTGHTPQKLPSFDAISCIIAVQRAESPYTRPIILPPIRVFVKHFLQKFFTFFVKFAEFFHEEYSLTKSGGAV